VTESTEKDGTRADSVARGDSWAGITAILVTACLWSLNGPLIKLINENGRGASGVTIAFYRSFIAGFLFLPLAWRHRATYANAAWSWRVGSVCVFTLMTAAFVIATTLTAASNAIVLQYTAPFWTFALSPLLLKVRPRRNEGAVLLLSMAGVAVIYFGSPPSDSVGLLTALISGFGYGTLIVVLRGLRNVNPYAVVCMNCLGSGALLAPAVLRWSAFVVTPAQFALIVVLGVFQFGLAYALFSWGLQRVEAHRASLISLLETILNPIWTFLFVGEAVPRPTWVGGPLILAGVVGWMLLNWRTERGRARSDPM
jgi:drug/metabolite transporter (DMT)-like permease